MRALYMGSMFSSDLMATLADGMVIWSQELMN